MSTEWNLNNLLLTNESFSNEIDDLPPPNVYQKKFFETPSEIKSELERDRECKEAMFRRWLVKNKPASAVLTPIETSTATGVPDLFSCYNGFSSWLECKVILSGSPRFRGTQYTYLKKLLEAGGHAKIVVQKLNPNTYKPSHINIYDAETILAIPSGMFKQQGQDMIFPPHIEPYYSWKYKSNLQDLYDKLLLDTNDFIW